MFNFNETRLPRKESLEYPSQTCSTIIVVWNIAQEWSCHRSRLLDLKSFWDATRTAHLGSLEVLTALDWLHRQRRLTIRRRKGVIAAIQVQPEHSLCPACGLWSHVWDDEEHHAPFCATRKSCV